MKFERKHPEALPGDRQGYETTFLAKMKELAECDNCRSFTRWQDVYLHKFVCSEECCAEMWRQKMADDPETNKQISYGRFEDEIKLELDVASRHLDDEFTKDIIIIVKDQLDYVKQCLESVMQHTRSYKIFLWDNGSKTETRQYLEQVHAENLDTIELMRSEDNMGFIQPNNTLVEWGSGDYIILLNSDTKVFEGWDTALIGFQQENPDIAITGYLGGLLDENGKGCDSSYGYNIDYVMGWCLCYKRELFEKYGLFNKQLTFAYCEDADLGLRMKENGKKVYALHAPLVHHFGNKTINEVSKEGEVNVEQSFELNHKYMQVRWKEYLSKNRVKR